MHMARSPSLRNGALSPPLSSTASYTASSQSKLNIVSRLAIEGKAKQKEESASINLYLKISVPVESVNPGQTIPLFSEENIKILDFKVHPLDADSAPYQFNSSASPLLHNAARALSLPERSNKNYLSLFDSAVHATPGRGSVGRDRDGLSSSSVPPLEERYTGYFAVSGYNICFVLPREFPPRLSSKTRVAGTDSEGDAGSNSRAGPRTPYRAGRRMSIGERNTIQFMAGLSLIVPFSSKPPKSPYLLSIPLPRCLSNNIKIRLPSPASITRSFASLESDEELNTWDLATEPHVTRNAKLSGRVSAYSEYADDESSDSSMAGVAVPEYRLIQGTFPSTDAIRIRWASPLSYQDFPDQEDGLRRLAVDSVQGHLTCTVLEARSDGSAKMRLDYQGTCTGLWFPGVATKLGMDIGLDTQGNRISWPSDSNARWTVDGDVALTGFSVGLSKNSVGALPPSAGLESGIISSLEIPPPATRDASGIMNEAPPFSGSSAGSSSTGTGGPSLLRVPLPNRQVSGEYSFEDSGSGIPSSIASSLHSSGTDMDKSIDDSVTRPPTTPITLHVNLNDLGPPPRNKLTVNVSGTVIITPTSRPPTGKEDATASDDSDSDSDSKEASLKLPEFHVFSANTPLTENFTTIVRNQCDGANIELLESQLGGSSSSNNNGFGKSSYNSFGKSTAKRTIVPLGSQVRCSLEKSEIIVKPTALKTPIRNLKSAIARGLQDVYDEGTPNTPTPGVLSRSTGKRKTTPGRRSRTVSPDVGDDSGLEAYVDLENPTSVASGIRKPVSRSQQASFLATLAGTMLRDGALVIPWVNVEVLPLSPSSSTSPNASRPATGPLSRTQSLTGTSSTGVSLDEKMGNEKWYYQYAVTISLPTPVDGPSEWLEFGLAPAPSPESDLSTSQLLNLAFPKKPSPQSIPVIEVKGASVNGVPVKFESFKPGGGVETKAGTEEDEKWMSMANMTMVRVHVALAGALEVVYIVKGVLVLPPVTSPGGSLADRKGKKSTEEDKDVDVLLPVFSIPVTRFEINVKRSADLTYETRLGTMSSLQGTNETSTPERDSYDTFRKVSAIDVTPYTHAFTRITLPKPLLLPILQQRRKSISRPSSLILPSAIITSAGSSETEVTTLQTFIYVLKKSAIYFLIFLLFIRQSTFMNTMYQEQLKLQRSVEVLPFRMMENVTAPIPTVTMTTTVTSSVIATRKDNNNRGWFGETTFTVTQVRPSPSPSKKTTVATNKVSDQTHDENGNNESNSESETEITSLSIPPPPGSPFYFPLKLSYKTVKNTAAYGWGRILRVVEVILHWPLPVEDR